MKLKKLFIGIVFITAISCGYSLEDFLYPPFTAVEEVTAVESSSICLVEKKRSSEVLPFTQDDNGTTVEIVDFVLKIDNRFASSPPRASPLA